MKGPRDRSWRLSPGMRDQPAKADQVVARIAGRQHGVVSVEQLRRAGLDKRAISRRVRTARLHPVHRGVYAVGHSRLTFDGRCMAAALALGDGAAVSHRSAAAVWGMLPTHEGSIEITIPGDGGREKRKGIKVHRSSTLIAGISTRRRGIAVTKPARTLRDLHRTVPQPVYQRAVRRSLDLRLISSADLAHEPDLTRSELERLFRRLSRRRRIPAPEVNAHVGRYEVDFLWREASVIVETDSFRHHGHRAAFEIDRARDADLQAQGYRVLRFTYRQVKDDPDSVLAAVGALTDPHLAD
jgi:very-short-patch-repair endonuclease